ncbi:helix-turn-helix transcriptional regulator [Rhizobium sp. P40RR-XXII]|uniref:helix-turn-helix transcriptional regulator n=1 Tax=Rhizobium sp. P40RR-XXII TaxID=2726739 RepID=UPI00145784AA|nr:helix-turn-helix transcriptional regulator [Rhizobium sp. P40RR-XXII]NLS18565.1 helix-turn-helix transcriptional regulator [Rhizobium sp. P40RR-XXII]
MVFNSEVLSSVIGSIYEAAYSPEHWRTVVEEMRVAFNGSKACLTKMGPTVTANDAITTGPNAEYLEKYLSEHAPYENALELAVAAAPEGLIYNDHALVGRDKLRRSRLWNEWMAPQDMYEGLASKLLTEGRSFWFFDIQRGKSQRSFDGEDIKWFKQVAPHLRRANQISRKFGGMKLMSLAFEHLPFGAVIVDGQRRVLATNSQAEAILSLPSCGITVRGGLLDARHSRNAEKLLHLIADASCRRDSTVPGTGGDMLMSSDVEQNEIPDLAVSVGPLLEGIHSDTFGGHAVVFIRKLSFDLPESFVDYMRTVFGMTPKEAMLSASLAEGLSLKDAAQRHGIRFTTARSYLESIFQKTGVRQQSQLVAVLKTIQPITWRGA